MSNRTMNAVLAAVGLLAISSALQAADRPWMARYERVEKLPRGPQTSFGKALLGGFDRTTVAVPMQAPYDVVWAATLTVTRRFAKEGDRPLIGMDEDFGRVQNGRIDLNSAFGSGSGDWLDEFVTEVTASEENLTMVSVTRRIVQREYMGGREWKTQPSNSKIESWIVTQIADEAGRLLAEGLPMEEESASAEEVRPVSEAPAVSGQPLTNEELLKLLQAGIGESVIVSKVRSSRCVTDASVDALIALKEAGASESILEAVAAAGCPTDG